MNYPPYSLIVLMGVPIGLLGVFLVWPLKDAPLVDRPGLFDIHPANIVDAADDGIYNNRSMILTEECVAGVFSLPNRTATAVCY